MRHSMSKDTAFNGETTPRHTFLCSDSQCLPPGDPRILCAKHGYLITGKSFIDTVNDRVLLKRLKSSFGISGSALSRFKSYLDGRSQCICVEGCCSGKFDLPHGVPQGSCLGPLLFTIYAGKLFEIVKAHISDVHADADGNRLYLSLKAVDAVQECIEDIRTWMAADPRKLNEGKTEVILIGTQQQLDKVNIAHLEIGQASVPIVSSAVLNLDSWFDVNLKMTEQINKTCQSVYYRCMISDKSGRS